jgi:hypothetical protein
VAVTLPVVGGSVARVARAYTRPPKRWERNWIAYWPLKPGVARSNRTWGGCLPGISATYLYGRSRHLPVPQGCESFWQIDFFVRKTLGWRDLSHAPLTYLEAEELVRYEVFTAMMPRHWKPICIASSPTLG